MHNSLVKFICSHAGLGKHLALLQNAASCCLCEGEPLLHLDIVGLVHQCGGKVLDRFCVILRQKFLLARSFQVGHDLRHCGLGGQHSLLQGNTGWIQLNCRLQDAQCLSEVAGN